jgi:hypothetical protein
MASSGTLLDTRARVRTTRLQEQASDTSSQTQTPGLVFFRHLAQQLARSNHMERATRREAVIERLRTSRDPIGYIGELLDQCVIERRSEGMDIAIDVLSHFGVHVIEFARQFWKKDVVRWEPAATSRHHVHDDIWYVLLRAAGASKLDAWQKIPMLSYCAADGTPSVREASVRALADVGNPIAIRLIKRLGGTDKSSMVREAAEEVLDDLEG